MAELRVFLFGAFQVHRNGHPLGRDDLRSQQARTILKVLLTRRGRPVAADQLIDLLWPHEDPDVARRHLHVRISQLRRALDPTAPSAHVLTVEGGYALDLQSLAWVDAFVFEAAAERGRHRQEAGDLTQAAADYEEAKGLYRGDYLEEDLYEDWSQAARERLRELFLTVLIELAECCAQRGRFRRAIACCQQVLAADPCREAAHMRLMVYYYHAGEQTQALAAYDRCRDVLRAELGVEPQPATRALAQQLRDGTLGAEGLARHYPPPEYQGRLFEVPYSLGSPPLVGREREYAWLVEHWRDPRASILYVDGEAGVGKTRLVSEFVGYVAAGGATVLRARADAGEGLPFGPVVAALRGLPGLGDADDLGRARLATLAMLFPEIKRRHPGLPAPAELRVDVGRERLLAAVEGLVRARVEPGAIVWVDDAHRADADSLTLLLRLAGHLKVVLTSRNEEMTLDHPLAIALRPLQREGRVAALTLQRLPPEVVKGLLGQLAQAELPALVARVIHESVGNPLFITASLQHLFEQGILYADTHGHWRVAGDLALPMAPRLLEVIEARVRGLAGLERQVFDLLAVAAGDVDSALLHHASHLDEDSLLGALDRLLASGLVVEPRSPGRGEYALAHERYAEVGYAALPLLRRRQVHRRLAEALEATAPDLDTAAPALATHYERGGEAARAFGWLLRAADVAQARYAHEEALAFCERAIAQEAGEPAPVWERMGRIAHHIGRYGDGVRAYEAALERRRALGDPAAQALTHLGLAECYRESSQYASAAGHARAGLELASKVTAQPALVARAHIILSNALRSGQLAPAVEVRGHLERALALARATDDQGLVGQATFWLGVLAVNSGDAAGALDHDRKALACFRAAGEPGWEAMALNNTAFHALLAGQARLALERAQEGLALARTIGSLNDQGWLLSTLGEVQTHLGQLEAARAALEEGLALVVRWGPSRLRPGLLADLARVAMARGDWEGALARLQEALPLALETAPQYVPRLRIGLAEAYLGLGKVAAAEAEARLAQEAAQAKGQRSVEGRAWRVLGSVSVAAGRAEEAETAFARSLELLEAVGDALEAARTRTAWGRWLARKGDGRAASWLETARRTFERCEAEIDLQLMAQGTGGPRREG